MRLSVHAGIVALTISSASARAVPEQALTPRHVFGTPEGICAPQPAGSGPVTNDPDTADAFLANPVYGAAANGVATPVGWSVAYQNLQAASTTGGYLGNEELTSYDVDYCAAQCCGFWPGCKSFNIYFERNPTIDPGSDCTNPPSLTRIKCSFWSETLSPSDATNDGQYCADFHVVIAGSNGYNVNGACSASTTTVSTTTASTTTPVTTTTTPVITTTTPITTTTTPITTTTTPVSTTTSARTTTAITTSTTQATTTLRTTTTQTTTTATPTPTGLSACPVPETKYTAKDGSTWAICKGATYEGQTTKNIPWIFSSNSCAEACSTTNGCTKAVFSPKDYSCSVKGGSLSWQPNPKYNTVRQLTPPKKQNLWTSWFSWSN